MFRGVCCPPVVRLDGTGLVPVPEFIGKRRRSMAGCCFRKWTPTLASVAPAGVGSLRGWRSAAAPSSRTKWARN